VIEGVAGNDYFEEEEGAVKPSEITASVGFNTGFGLLSIRTQLPNTSTNKSIFD
jgi:hypothetical protein